RRFAVGQLIANVAEVVNQPVHVVDRLAVECQHLAGVAGIVNLHNYLFIVFKYGSKFHSSSSWGLVSRFARRSRESSRLRVCSECSYVSRKKCSLSARTKAFASSRCSF